MMTTVSLASSEASCRKTTRPQFWVWREALVGGGSLWQSICEYKWDPTCRLFVNTVHITYMLHEESQCVHMYGPYAGLFPTLTPTEEIEDRTVAPHAAGHRSQHASFIWLVPSVCGDRRPPQDILNSNNNESELCGFQDEPAIQLQSHRVRGKL